MGLVSPSARCSAAKKRLPCQDEHPDHSSSLVRLKKVSGQLNGILSMIEERRYCVDILIQMKAISSALKAAEAEIFGRHLRNCVRSAMEARNPAAMEAKIDELVALVQRRI